MSDFRRGTSKNWTLEGKNLKLGGLGGQKLPQKIGHHLCMFPCVNQYLFQIADTIVKEDLQALCKVFPVLVNLGHFQRFKLRVIR